VLLINIIRIKKNPNKTIRFNLTDTNSDWLSLK